MTDSTGVFRVKDFFFHLNTQLNGLFLLSGELQKYLILLKSMKIVNKRNSMWG